MTATIDRLRWWPLAALFILSSMLGGCATPDNSEPPAELTDIVDAEKIHTRWSRSIDSASRKHIYDLQPLLHQGKIYAINPNGRIFQFDAETGRKEWDYDTELRASTGVGGNSSGLIACSRDGEVAFYDFAEEEGLTLRWKKQLSSTILSRAILDDGQVFVRTGDGKLYALDASSGATQWAISRRVPALSLTGNSPPLLAGDLVIGGFDNGKLVAFERDSGTTAWETSIGTPRGRTEIERLVDLDGRMLLRDSVIYVSSFQGNLAAVTVNGGQVIWSRRFSSSQAIAADDEALYLVDDRSHLWSIDRRTGSAFWKQDVLNARKITAPIVVDDRLVVGDLAGYVHFLQRGDGQLKARIRIGEEAIISQPLQDESTALLLDRVGQLVALALIPKK